ncbi:response regulator [Peredibacter starrii]|uniref:Response regulator transcription factor n=1 Tax=Peredibacter starrii TaxID=28202 RepID=A0AAX4HMA7_9BACT|nr:response regulator transcription factor [Peredibacter starrii]WPU64356.1 response regulator transcription factor [Peredibacter starrii]
MTDSKTILIIEDEKVILHTLKDFLEVEGYDVLIAGNGLVALELLNNTPMPDLLLLDMKMPKMNGWEFARAYSENFKERAPIIVATAAVDAEQRARDVNAIDWVEKPFNLDILLEKIKKYTFQ